MEIRRDGDFIVVGDVKILAQRSEPTAAVIHSIRIRAAKFLASGRDHEGAAHKQAADFLEANPTA